MSRTLLLVEDNEDDVFFFNQARQKAGLVNPVQVVEDGQEALDYLNGAGRYADRTRFPMPALVLLDLKLPYIPGLEVLEAIRKSPELENTLVVILTSSREERDIDTAYRLGANSFLVKPPSAAKLQEMVRSLGEYWLRHNIAPAGVEG